MRTGMSDILSQGHSGRLRLDARLKRARKSRNYRIDLEGLESRTLLATIPAVAATAAPQNVSSLMGNLGGVNASESSSVVAVDPLDPTKLVAAWVDNDSTAELAATNNVIAVVVEAAYSVNAGQSWLPLYGEPTNGSITADPELLDPTTSGPTVAYKYVTDPSVGFDDTGNFYILSEYSNSPTAAASSSGALVLQKYSFNGSTPRVQGFASNEQTPNPYGFGLPNLKVIYQWLSSGTNDQAVDPTMAVDDNLSTIPNGVTSQADAFSGNIYVGWAGIDVDTSQPIAGFNPNRTKVVVSSDGGNNFSPVTIGDVNSQTEFDDGNALTAERDATPALTVSQGRLPSESGVGGDAGIAGGQVAVTWDDFGTGRNQIMANTISAGRDLSFGQQADTVIPEGTLDTTDFTIPVSISNTAGLTSLDVTVNIVDSSDQFLGLTLRAPSGDTFTLLLNQIPFIGAMADTGIGIGGSDLGVKTYTMNNIGDYALGTTFDDNATRDIFDPTGAGTNAISGPAVGDYQPENGGTLDGFLARELSKGINGTWTLETNDTNKPPTTPPATPNFVINWSLSFGRGLTADNDIILPGTNGLAIAGSVNGTGGLAGLPSSPVSIGPGLVMAQDNTLGANSPFEGRIYVAFVGYFNVTVDNIKNPATNTDIFLSFSDNDGRTWSDPVEVNDDSSDTDGSTGASENFDGFDEFDGRSQYQPAIAVDPTTGTVVISWRDARNDPANTLVATYIATSIDGGNTFSAQTYANASATATNAIDGQTAVLGPQGDNATATDNSMNATFGFGSSMGLAVYGGQVFPVWAGNSDEATFVNNVPAGIALSIFSRPMVIAAGPRIINSTMGPIPLSEPKSGNVTFTVTFDRPVASASFTPGDVQVYYHDTTSGDPSIPLEVTGVTPIASSGAGPNDSFGFTQFTIAFNPNVQANYQAGTTAPSNIVNYTGTYSYLITPDDGNGNPIVSPIASFVDTEVEQPVIGPVASTQVPLRIPSSGTGGSGTADDFTTSTLAIGGHNNQTITGLTVNLSLTHQNASDLTITLTAPDGQTGLVFQGTANGPITLNNQPFAVTGVENGLVNGTYTLTIDDTQVNNTGTLTGWSVTIDSAIATRVFQDGAPMDQNADGTADENPLTLPGGFTGTTPGDVYAVPTPQLTAPITFTSPAYIGGVNTGGYILSPPFNQNTLPLIVTGPQVVSTQAVGTSGQLSSSSDNLLTDDSTNQFDVTFDRPVQTSTFTPSQVLSIMGATGPISGPQLFPETSVDQMIPKATVQTMGSLPSTVVVPNFDGTFTAGDVTVSLDITDPSDSNLSAVLIAPNGTKVVLFANVAGQNFTNTVFDDAAETPITQGTGSFTGSFQPIGKLSSLIGLNASGTWTLQLSNGSQSTSGVLVNWALHITPQITVTPVAASESTVNGVQMATQFAIHFPQQQLSGTYTIQLGPGILDQFNDGQDATSSAGLNVLRDEAQNGPTTTVQYVAADLPKTIPASSSPTAAGSVSSSIVVPDSFIIEGDQTADGLSVMQVQLNLSYADDPNLTATLFHYDLSGDLLGEVTLFSNVGTGIQTADFNNTVFDDNAPTPIQDGSAPFSATYNPQQSLATVFAPTMGGQQGMNVQGTWTLVVQNSSTTGTTGTINGWSLTFQKPLPTSGLGEQGSDDASVSFRLFTLGQTDALSSQAWTSVGGASSTDETGQVNAIGVDPSDPSGNTVYAGGAGGGIWKTTDFLTTSPGGPTWIPLTNFGPSSAIYISSIAVFARNQNPNQSIIVAATGGDISGQEESDAEGVGFLISTDGGVTWNLDDSTDNVSSVNNTASELDNSSNVLPIDSTARNREFVGTTAYQVTVDPELTTTGQVIIYAALSGTNGGIWRSENTGQTWTQMLAGNATAVVLDPNSGLPLDPISGNAPISGPGSPTFQGNYQIVYAGIEGQGVFMSTNQGQSFSLMAGNVGNPLIVDVITGKDVNPLVAPNPNGAEGRIVLTVPAATNNYVQSEIYSGWLYAAVATSTGAFDGEFVTKDFGQNWTKIQLNSLPPLGPEPYNEAVPTSDTSQPQYAITDDNQGNKDLALTIDPQNPNITYLGGFGGDGYNSDTGLIRVDSTNLQDAHSLLGVLFDHPENDLTLQTNAWTTIDNVLDGEPVVLNEATGFFDPTPYLNFIRNPQAPFLVDSTLLVENYAAFSNSGAGATWTPMDVPVTGLFTPPGSNSEISGTGYQILLTEVDPTTGLTRLLAGNLTGIYSGLDNDGTFEATIGSSTAVASVNRNGNLDLAQFYYGAIQPSNAAAQAAAALFFAGAENIGGQASDPGLIANGDIQASSLGDGGTFFIASGTAVDQQGSGTLFQYWSPGQGGADTSFVLVNGVGRTFGLLQASGGDPTPDPQWALTSYASIVVNPVDSDDDLISSGTGNVFESTNQGETWFDIGQPSTFGSPANTSFALAFGAPDPSAPAGIGNLGNFVYVGTSTGKIFVSQNAGGSWLNISLGLDGSSVQQIITDPARGSHEVYAVTRTGVFFLQDSIVLGQNATTAADEWVNISGGVKSLATSIFGQSYTIFGQNYDPTTDPNAEPYFLTTVLNSIAANWNYTIPNNPDNLSLGYHPVLYVAGNSGVYMSTDNGTTWSLYPSTTFGAVAQGGDLPHADITDLSLSQGNIAVATGMPDLAGPFNPEHPNATPDPDLLLATTFGEGAFAINLAPMLFPTTVGLDPSDGTTDVTTTTPIIDGESEISGFGGATWVSIVDETPGDPTFGKIIGGFNPALVTSSTKSITANASNSTDAFGNFKVSVNAGVFTSDGQKTIELFTTDDAGSVSNKVSLQFDLEVPGLSPPSAPVTPTLQLVTSTPGFTNSPTPELKGTTSSSATVELFQVIAGVPTPFTPAVTTTADANGNFTLAFPNMTGGVNGTYGPYTVVAQASNSIGKSGFSTPPTTFTIIIGTPKAPANFSLAPTSDTGIVGDDVTSDRTPDFIGKTEPNATVELFQVVPAGQTSPIYDTVTADSSGNFSVQLPFALSDGTVSLYVQATDPAGNASTASNTLTVRIVSVASDYNGDSFSDAALYSRGTTNFTGVLTSGSALVTGINSLTGLIAGVTITGTGIPAGTTIKTVNTTPFAGTLTSGSALVTGITSTAGLFAGESVTGTGVPAGTTIKTVNSLTTITLTANAITSGSPKLTATTITLTANATGNGSQTLTADVGLWLVKTTSVGPASPAALWFTNGTAFGPSNVTPFQGDFDGDGLTDLAYYQPSTATWYMDDSQSNTITSFTLGTPNPNSIPVVGYFNASGPEEAAVFTQGVWNIAGGGNAVQFGQAGDIPVPGDYTGVGFDELAVYRPSTGQFLVQVPGTTPTTMTISIPGIGVGNPFLPSLVPVPGAYDNQSYFASHEPERTEAAVFNPVTGVYTILGPNGVDTPKPTFAPGDIPAPADYLGNGSTQAVVFRPSTGQFIEAGGTVIATFSQASADIPLTAPLFGPGQVPTPGYRAPSDPPPGTGTGTGTGTRARAPGTGTGTGTTGTGTGTGTTGTGTGSSSSGQGSSGTTSSPPPVTSTPPLAPPGTSSHKKKVSKKKVAAPPKKKVAVHAKPKKVVHHSAPKPKVRVVSPAKKKVIKVSTSHSALAKKPTHVVDMALESVHVNLRRAGKEA